MKYVRLDSVVSAIQWKPGTLPEVFSFLGNEPARRTKITSVCDAGGCLEIFRSGGSFMRVIGNDWLVWDGVTLAMMSNVTFNSHHREMAQLDSIEAVLGRVQLP